MNPVLYQKEREDAMINAHVDICCMFYMWARKSRVCSLLLIWGFEDVCGVKWH